MQTFQVVCKSLTFYEKLWYTLYMIRCILFDRDGTLGELSDNRYPQTFTPFTDVKQVFTILRQRGFLVGIISNQASIARGTGKDYDFGKEFSSYGVDAWAICPHDSADNCDCRKPKSGLLLSVANQLGVSPKECLVVGDRVSDLLCATNVGASAVLVLTGYGKKEKDEALRLYPTLPILDRFDKITDILT